MYRELSSSEIKRFQKKYLSNFNEDIDTISCISYRFVREYLVNDHCFVIVKPFKIIYKILS